MRWATGTEREDPLGTHTYAYDDLYRLTSVTYPGPSTTGYAFDAFGNRTSMTTGAGTTTYAYDDADRLTSVTPPGQSAIAYTWDDNGNLTGRGSDTFDWDYNDRMVAATIGGVSSSFAYLGDGLRNSRTVGSSTTVFTWDTSGEMPVVLDDGSQYVHGAGLAAQVTPTDTYYYLADGLGSTMRTVDSSGVVVNEYEYDVYGTLRSSSGSQDNEFQFAGQQTDPTGLQYLRARYYDMEAGIFLSRDPLAASQAWTESPFAYASGNATNLLDPLGLCSWKVWECWDEAKGAVEGIGSRAWYATRAAVNAPLSGWATTLAYALGGSCEMRSDGIIGCFGVSASLFEKLKASAVTIGNVILTREKSWTALGDDLIRHEIKHADQWAKAGLATFPLPMVGQAVFAGTYVAAQILFETCGNPFEKAAGIGRDAGVRRSCG